MRLSFGFFSARSHRCTAAMIERTFCCKADSRSERLGRVSIGDADTNVSTFARARNICCGHKFCVRDTKNVFDFVQKHFVSATNVSQFERARKRHKQQCFRNNVSSFATALTDHEFMLIFKLFNHGYGFIGFMVSWFHGFMVSWFQRFHGFRGFIGFHGFIVSEVSWFHWFHDLGKFS